MVVVRQRTDPRRNETVTMHGDISMLRTTKHQVVLRWPALTLVLDPVAPHSPLSGRLVPIRSDVTANSRPEAVELGESREMDSVGISSVSERLTVRDDHSRVVSPLDLGEQHADELAALAVVDRRRRLRTKTRTW